MTVHIRLSKPMIWSLSLDAVVQLISVAKYLPMLLFTQQTLQAMHYTLYIVLELKWIRCPRRLFLFKEKKEYTG